MSTLYVHVHTRTVTSERQGREGGREGGRKGEVCVCVCVGGGGGGRERKEGSREKLNDGLRTTCRCR